MDADRDTLWTYGNAIVNQSDGHHSNTENQHLRKNRQKPEWTFLRSARLRDLAVAAGGSDVPGR